MENLKSLIVHRGRGRSEDGQWLLVNTTSESSTDEDFSPTENPMRPRSHLVESRKEGEPSRKTSSNSYEETPRSNEDSGGQTERVTNVRPMPNLTRRNAICDVIEKHMYSGNRSLRKEREDLLRCITLGNYSLL